MAQVYLLSMSDTASIRELRERIADVVDRAAHDDVPTVITRRGREVAAVVPIETLREWQRWEEQQVTALIDERMRASDGTGATLAEVMAETLARPE